MSGTFTVMTHVNPLLLNQTSSVGVGPGLGTGPGPGMENTCKPPILEFLKAHPKALGVRPLPHLLSSLLIVYFTDSSFVFMFPTVRPNNDRSCDVSVWNRFCIQLFCTYFCYQWNRVLGLADRKLFLIDVFLPVPFFYSILTSIKSIDVHHLQII